MIIKEGTFLIGNEITNIIINYYLINWTELRRISNTYFFLYLSFYVFELMTEVVFILESALLCGPLLKWFSTIPCYLTASINYSPPT